MRLALLLVTLVGAGLAIPNGAAAATIDVTRGDDPPLSTTTGCSLRQAVQAANVNAAVGACPAGEPTALDTIRLPVSVRLTIAGPVDDNDNQTGDLDVLAGGPLRITGTAAGASTIAQTVTERVLNLVAGSLELERVVVTGGNIGAVVMPPASDGGGISARAATKLTLTDSTVSGNTARQSGAIANGTRVTNDNGGEVLIVDSTVSGNRATANSGGGMGAGGIGNINGTLTLVNSTLSGNETAGGRGGGIYSEALSGQTSTVNVLNSTLAANASSSGANLHNSGNGGIAAMRLRSSILSGPRNDTNCGSSGNGGFSSQGYNLADDDSCRLIEATDRPEADPLLGPLAANGGLTLTHALGPSSPAIDRGTSDTALTGIGVLSADQRGLPRPRDFAELANTRGGDGADVGAFELQPSPPGQLTPGQPPLAVSRDDSVTISIAGRRLRIGRNRVTRVRLTCPRAEQSPPCRGTLTLRTRSRVKFAGRRRLVVIAGARFQIAAGTSKVVRLRLAPSKLRLIRGNRLARRAVAIANVRDAAGNVETVRKRLRVLRPPRDRARSS